MANPLKALFQDQADAIREGLGDIGKIAPADFPARTREIVALIGSGGGSSEDVKYVTFMNEDGTTELYKRGVISGNDCGDVIALGLLEEQTKESTNTEVFTRSGWSLTAGGSADDSALKDVTEDRIVYVAFTASTRYYTVNFYDGEELKNTVQVEYGASAAYTLEKDGYIFNGWEPSNTNIVADTDCYAQWSTALTFANATWAQIAEISEAGNAASIFSVGDSRTLEIDGEIIEVEIVGFNHDTLSDGSGKAGISMICKTLPSLTYGTSGATNVKDGISTVLFAMLPAELQSVIKQVNKQCDNTYTNGYQGTEYIDMKVWLPSVTELGIQVTSFSSVSSSEIQKYISTLGSVYELYSETACPVNKYGKNSSTVWITRTYWRAGYNCILGTAYNSASNTYRFGFNNNWTNHLLPFGFCI